jgi:hypothetical protein
VGEAVAAAPAGLLLPSIGPAEAAADPTSVLPRGVPAWGLGAGASIVPEAVAETEQAADWIVPVPEAVVSIVLAETGIDPGADWLAQVREAAD